VNAVEVRSPEPAAIVQVTLWQSPYLGNFMSSQLRLAGTVREALGLETHVVLAEGALGQPWCSELASAGVSWSVLPERGRKRRVEHLVRVAREHGAAIVHSHFTRADVDSLAAARRTGARCIWQMHTGFEGYSLRQRLKDLVKVGRLGRRVDCVIVVSDWLAALAQRRGFPADKVIVLPNAIVLDRFEILPEKEHARAVLGLDRDAQVALVLAWWPEVKGVDVVIAALAQLAHRQEPVTGLLVGEQRLERFLDGVVPNGAPWLRVTPFVDDPAPLYAAADVFVSASRHEGYSYAVGEALACGLPVVLSDIEGTRLFTRAPGAVTFPVGDASALADQLERVLRDPDRERLRAANRAWALDHLAIGPWCSRMVALYRGLLERQAAHPRSIPAQLDR
jgi:glycosyltransferase involved in cell wall biosynthesis